MVLRFQLLKSLCWSSLLAGLWREKLTVRQVCWQDLGPYGGPTPESLSCRTASCGRDTCWQFLKCGLWEGAKLEEFLEDCHLWEGPLLQQSCVVVFFEKRSSTAWHHLCHLDMEVVVLNSFKRWMPLAPAQMQQHCCLAVDLGCCLQPWKVYDAMLFLDNLFYDLYFQAVCVTKTRDAWNYRAVFI